ncbi:unnamed protein product [Clonostachys chloroleuca]|uniref:Uncharacterized protein n=1 Tax=Clonostachys chloroleuca TaxID=1926264 RepID=A0AA35Q6U5_9HYPO|nr:unnamed protein product [Clonostachys chloroleuca]
MAGLWRIDATTLKSALGPGLGPGSGGRAGQNVPKGPQHYNPNRRSGCPLSPIGSPSAAQRFWTQGSVQQEPRATGGIMYAKATQPTRHSCTVRQHAHHIWGPAWSRRRQRARLLIRDRPIVLALGHPTVDSLSGGLQTGCVSDVGSPRCLARGSTWALWLTTRETIMIADRRLCMLT